MTSDRSVRSIERVAQAAEALGLPIDIKTMDQSTRTAEDAAQACGCDVAQIVKSLIFEDANAGALVLLLVSGRHDADTDYISATYGLMLKRCDARRVRDETGFAIGGVAPIGLVSPVATYMDSVLLSMPVVWCAAGRPDSVFSVAPEMLRDATQATVIDVRRAVPTGRLTLLWLIRRASALHRPHGCFPTACIVRCSMVF